MKEIRVSIVIPARGRARLLNRAVASVLDQSIAPVEIIIVDDGSQPPLEPQLELASHSSVVLLRYESGVNAAYARNRGIEKAKGRWVAFLDSDDWWLPGHLETALACMHDKQFVGVVGAYRSVYAPDCEEIHQGPGEPEPGGAGMLRYLFEQGGITRMSTMIVKRSVLDSVRFDERLFKHQDWDFAVSVATQGRIAYNPSAEVCVDHMAVSRMSGKANPDATLLFLQKHGKNMCAKTRNGFLVWAATSAALRQDRSAVAQILSQLVAPKSHRHWSKAIMLRVIAWVPGLPKLIKSLYVVQVRLRARWAA